MCSIDLSATTQSNCLLFSNDGLSLHLSKNSLMQIMFIASTVFGIIVYNYTCRSRTSLKQKELEYNEKDSEYAKTREENGYLKAECTHIKEDNLKMKQLIAMKNQVALDAQKAKMNEPRWKVIGKQFLHYTQIIATINSIPSVASNTWYCLGYIAKLVKMR